MFIEDPKRMADEHAQLVECRRRFRGIVEALLDGILVLDPQDHVLFCNPAAGILFNTPVQDLLGKKLVMSLPESGTTEIELAYPFPEKEPRLVLARAQKTTWDEKPARLVVLMDITVRKETEEELEVAQQAQLRMKDEFLSHVSHELRTPLSAVYQYVTILLDGLAGEINAEQRAYLGIAMRNVNQLRAMIGDLLDVSRCKSGKMKVTPCEMDPAAAIQGSIETVWHDAQAKDHDLSAEIAENLPAAYADPLRVQQIIVNLLDNAIKFTPPGGTIRVGAKVCEPSAEGNRDLEIFVSDTGCGIAPEDQERIFHHLQQLDSFIDQKRKGLGLGLFICRDLVTRLKGKIRVESRVGAGSTFSFTLPVFVPEHAVSLLIQNRLERTYTEGESALIIVVDTEADEQAVRPVWDALQSVLKKQSFAVAHAGKALVVLADAGEVPGDFLRNHVRRLTKDACFAAAPDLCLALSYGVAVSSLDSDTAEALLARARANAVTERAIITKKRLILVDDDENVLKVMTRLLATWGIKNVRTETGGDGLFAALDDELPDLIIVDIHLPGMNGHEIIGRLKQNERTATIPILVVSGYVGDSRHIVDNNCGATIPVLSKLDMPELLRWVQYML